jgi:ribosomal protein L24E
LLKQNPDKINWCRLSFNDSKEAVELLKQNPDKINWSRLSFNDSKEAVELLKQHQTRLNGVIYRLMHGSGRVVETEPR